LKKCQIGTAFSFKYKFGKNWQTRAWDPVFKTDGSAPDAAMVLGLFSQKKIKINMIVSYIELFISILIFFGASSE
jgi:hypothetical protein